MIRGANPAYPGQPTTGGMFQMGAQTPQTQIPHPAAGGMFQMGQPQAPVAQPTGGGMFQMAPQVPLAAAPVAQAPSPQPQAPMLASNMMTAAHPFQPAQPMAGVPTNALGIPLAMLARVNGR
jgi:hypothetical protein